MVLAAINNNFSTLLTNSLDANEGRLKTPKKEYKIKETKHIVEGSMTNGYGEVDIQLTSEVFAKLVNKSPKGVTFKSRYLEHFLVGGVCSAHTLTFIKNFYELSNLELHERVVKAAEPLRRSNIELRSHQAALNAICKDYLNPAEDLLKAKIKALANLHDFEVDFAFPGKELITEDNKAFYLEQSKSIPEGIYLVRSVQHANNHKGEYYGHSMAFIKNEEGNYFFDPTYGLTQLSQEDSEEKVFNLVNNQCSTWRLESTRMYRLAPTNS